MNGVAFGLDGKLAGADGQRRGQAVEHGDRRSRRAGAVGYWIILAGAVLAIALSALAVLITTREIWLARQR